VDSELARESNIGVQEMINGCMCCVLVGQMKLALLELKGITLDLFVYMCKRWTSNSYHLLRKI
jgi:G3E family GTPase